MASNKSEAPTEPFKRALAHAARSLAELPDLEIVFSAEGPSLTGHRAVLPHPPRDLPPREAARIRGLADQMALRLAHHDEGAHGRLAPRSPEGQAVFERIEQARTDAIGANALGGVRANLAAALESEIERKGLNRVQDRARAPMADVLSLLVRERLTGDAPPHGAKALVDQFRGDIEGRAGKDLDQLLAAIDDQSAFGRLSRAILRDPDLVDAADAEESEGEEGEEEPEGGEGENQQGEQGEGESAPPERVQLSDQQADSADAEMIQVDDMFRPPQTHQVEQRRIDRGLTEDDILLQRRLRTRERPEQHAHPGNVFHERHAATRPRDLQRDLIAADFPQLKAGGLHFGMNEMPLHASQVLFIGADGFPDIRGVHVIEVVHDAMAVRLDNRTDLKSCTGLYLVDGGIRN